MGHHDVLLYSSTLLQPPTKTRNDLNEHARARLMVSWHGICYREWASAEVVDLGDTFQGCCVGRDGLPAPCDDPDARFDYEASCEWCVGRIRAEIDAALDGTLRECRRIAGRMTAVGISAGMVAASIAVSTAGTGWAGAASIGGLGAIAGGGGALLAHVCGEIQSDRQNQDDDGHQENEEQPG